VSGLRVLHVYPKGRFTSRGRRSSCASSRSSSRDRGHEVVVATRPSEHWARLCRQEGLAHYGVPMTSEVDLASAWRLARILRTHRIGVVHAHKGKGRTLALMAGLLVRIPVPDPEPRRELSARSLPAPRLHDGAGHGHRRGLRVHQAGARGFRRRRQEDRSDLLRHRHDPLSSGVDGAAVRRELGFTPGDFVITQIGVRSWKGNDDVIDAMVAVAAGGAGGAAADRRRPESRVALRARPATPTGRPRARHRLPRGRPRDPRGLGLLRRRLLRRPRSHRHAARGPRGRYARRGDGSRRQSRAGRARRDRPSRAPTPRRCLARALLEIITDRPRACAMAMEGHRRVEANFSTAVKAQRIEALYRRLLAEASAE